MHEKFLTGIQINVFALAVLIIILTNIRKRPDKGDSPQKVYWGLVVGNIVMIAIDITVNVFNGKDIAILRQLHIVVETMDYILAPVVGMLWAIYVEMKIDRHGNCTKRLVTPLALPVVLNASILIANIGRGFVFYIDANNIYHRGEFFWISVMTTYLYILYALVRIIKNRNSIRRTDYRALVFFPFLPFIGGLVQVAFYDVTLMWTSTALSMLIVFINIQNDQLSRDHLTGLYNRRQLEGFISNYIKYGDKNKPLAGIMIDVDDFKKINDEHGHVEGDRALEYLGDILQRSFRREDFVARYAGDEFVVLSKVEDYSDLERMVDRLRETVISFNKSKIVPYVITVSLGYDILDEEKHSHSESFIKHIDDLMYEHKKR